MKGIWEKTPRLRQIREEKRREWEVIQVIGNTKGMMERDEIRSSLGNYPGSSAGIPPKLREQGTVLPPGKSHLCSP